jgi:hypothetical protein
MSLESFISTCRSSQRLRAATAHGLLLALMSTSRLTAAPPPFEVVDGEPAPAWSAGFQRTEGWTGADVAYSIVLGRDKTLWIFADTFIGRIENGRRVGARMINNSFAWQSHGDRTAPWQFFWKGTAEAPAAIVTPTEPGPWYWPGDGVLSNDRLYLVAKLVRKKDGGPPGLAFDWCGNHLLEIANPYDEPTAWRYQAWALPTGASEPQLSSACLTEDGYLYLYGLFPAKALQGLHRPLALSRISLASLPGLQEPKLEYLCRGEQEPAWSPAPSRLLELFGDAAPEMTVNRLPGWSGFVATYTSLGLGGEIMVRHAPRPEGPWSDALRVYHCPEADRGLLVYGAKSHPELAARDGEMIITYCVNTGSLAEHVARPDIYVPRAVSVHLRPRATTEKR